MWDVSEQEFSDVIDTNIKGIYNTIKEFVPNMIKTGKGTVVNFSSGWGRSTSPEVAPYCSSKWAVEGLTRSLAQALPPGVAAIPLNPGIIHTTLLESCFGDSASQFPSPQQWARDAVPFLLGLTAADNGQPLTVH